MACPAQIPDPSAGPGAAPLDAGSLAPTSVPPGCAAAGVERPPAPAPASPRPTRFYQRSVQAALRADRERATRDLIDAALDLKLERMANGCHEDFTSGITAVRPAR